MCFQALNMSMEFQIIIKPQTEILYVFTATNFYIGYRYFEININEMSWKIVYYQVRRFFVV